MDLKDSKAPASLGDRLKVMSKEDEHSIRRITYNEIKKEFNLHGAGTNGNYEKGYFNGISDILIVDDCLWDRFYS